MPHVQINVAHPMVIMADHPDFLGSLDEKQLTRVEQKGRHTGLPTSHLAIEHRFAGKHRVIDFPQLSDNPWPQNRIGEVRNAKGRRYTPRTRHLIADVRMILVGSDGSGSTGRRYELHARSEEHTSELQSHS